MSCEWFDDPIFDATVEQVNGKILRGDVWRRYQFLKERAAERGVKGTLVGVNGTTFAAQGVHGRKRARDGAMIVPEPGHVTDKNALRVDVGGEAVGYIPKAINTTVAPGPAHVVKIGATKLPHCWLFVEEA